jgi:hypothetical protein
VASSICLRATIFQNPEWTLWTNCIFLYAEILRIYRDYRKLQHSTLNTKRRPLAFNLVIFICYCDPQIFESCHIFERFIYLVKEREQGSILSLIPLYFHTNLLSSVYVYFLMAFTFCPNVFNMSVEIMNRAFHSIPTVLILLIPCNDALGSHIGIQ